MSKCIGILQSRECFEFRVLGEPDRETRKLKTRKGSVVPERGESSFAFLFGEILERFTKTQFEIVGVKECEVERDCVKEEMHLGFK